MPQTKQILYVEDDPDSCEIMTYLFEAEGLETVVCATSEEGLEKAKEGGYSVIILDHRLADISGVQICREIRTYDSTTPIIFYTADALPSVRAEAAAAGAQAFFVKPQDLTQVVETVKLLA